MQFDMEQLSADNRYKLLTATVTPRPIAWVTSRSVDGVVNAAPFSFFNVMGHEPPTVTLGLLRKAGGGYKDTAANIMATGEFVINLVSEAMAESMNETCTNAPPEIDELELAGLTAVPSIVVAPPRIAGCPVSFECRSLSSIVTGPCQVIVVATVLHVHIEDEFLIDAERCHVDTPALKLVSRMHGSGWYARSTDLFQLARPSYKEK
ncbi:flavin reductase family protein [Herminiimonas arsenitoxidans]|uniref:flavin reductase family protein n=1 Tax=Herminiimonas arsenitoxidans TaxID=1809410 RepID=UPI000970F00E|nr:flavin reductase family protein [Herminiimonas arsenitoxidans]